MKVQDLTSNSCQQQYRTYKVIEMKSDELQV